MAYFPNGDAGDLFQIRQCFRCKNYRDKGDGRGPGCGIWDAHLLFAYVATGEQRLVLDTLIPMDDADVVAGDCTMFVNDHDTQPLPGVE